MRMLTSRKFYYAGHVQAMHVLWGTLFPSLKPFAVMKLEDTGIMRLIQCAALFILGASSVAHGQRSTVDVSSIERLIRSHDYEQALETTRSALHNAPKDFRLWTLEGIIYSNKGSNQDAINAFEKALEISPNYAAALRGEVQLLYQAQDKRAIPLLERILKANPQDETAHEMLATIEEKQGNCQAALTHFLASAEVIGTHPVSLEEYGYCLVRTGQPQKAIPVFEQLSALLPQSAYPKFDLAILLVETKQDEAALQVLEPLLAADQSDPESLSLASEAYEAVGNTPKAVSLLRQAIVLSPETADYYNAFVLLCLDHESFQVGIDMLNAGLQRIKDDPSLYISRGLLYAQLADYEKAEADFSTAEHIDSRQSLSAYATDILEVQRAMSDKSHPDKAILEIRSQLKAHPDSALLHLLLAKLLVYQESDMEAKSSGEAIRSAQIAVKLKPDLVEARDLLASIYTRSGQYNLAIVQCRLALEYSPSDQTAIYHLIIALRHSEQVGQRDEIPALVKRLSGLQEASRQQQTDRKRFQLVEGQPEPLK
jgi:tetratricopeptide (TPR) repeat protein